MRNKILIPLFLVAIAAIAGWNISQSKSDATLSDVALANVEALADSECFSGVNNCGSNCPWEWCGYCAGLYLQECWY